MFVLPGYKIRHDVLLMWKITACFDAVNTETVSIVWTCRFARKWTGLCMGVLLNGHLPRVFLALKKHLSSSLEPWQPSYLAGISLELQLVAAWLYKPYRTGCEGPVQMNGCSVGPDHFALVSFTLVVQIRLYFGSDGNRCRLTPSLVVLLQPAATHLDDIIGNNKLQTWYKTLGNFSSNTLHAVWYTTHTWASAVWITDRESPKCTSRILC